jgi:hypothetical protein
MPLSNSDRHSALAPDLSLADSVHGHVVSYVAVHASASAVAAAAVVVVVQNVVGTAADSEEDCNAAAADVDVAYQYAGYSILSHYRRQQTVLQSAWSELQTLNVVSQTMHTYIHPRNVSCVRTSVHSLVQGYR